MDERQKAKSVMQQKRLCDHMLNHRIILQKPLVAANSLLQSNKEDLEVTRMTKCYIKSVQKLQRKVMKASGNDIKLQVGDEFEVLDANLEACMPFVESTIERWSSRYKAVDLGSKKGTTIMQQIKTQNVKSLVA